MELSINYLVPLMLSNYLDYLIGCNLGKKEEDFDSFINSYAKVKIVHLDFYKDKIETNAFKKAFSFILE